MTSLHDVSHRHDDAPELLETDRIPPGTPILELIGLQKKYGAVEALKPAHLTFLAGEIHAIVGENGAGKSTLMKVLSGVYPHGDYEGTIRYQGEECRFRGIQDSEEEGIIIIHQELALVPLLSITENVFLGNEVAHRGVIDWMAAHRQTQDLLRKVGLKESPSTRITDLGVGKQQLVEIAKALSRKVKLLIRGADLLNGTPIVDIKPYIAYSDAIPEAKSGFAQTAPALLSVKWTEVANTQAQALIEQKLFDCEQQSLINELLALDPRPAYQDDESRIYGMRYGQVNVLFKIAAQQVWVESLTKIDR